MHLPVVYEDSNIIVLNKPSGISMHKTSINDQHETIADILIKHYPYLEGIGEDPLRPGIVHRLDKETSGLVLIAKNKEAFSYLKGLFQAREIHKTYIALVYGRPEKSYGTIDIPLGKIGTKQTTQIQGRRELTERQALTDYKVITTFNNYSLLEVSPKTGRTHQIRIHLKSIGHPIVGDSLYGPRKGQRPASLNRMFLHAQRLSFTTQDNKALALEVDLPEDLQNILSGLQ
jgi:23S rRNA pseudouridine1911/1915/1917 synthase